MKTNLSLFLIRWLAVTALFDWFVTRTITRATIFVPKPAPVILLYQALNVAGQLALTLTGLLALSVLGWIAWHEWRQQHKVGLALALVGQMLLSLLSLVVPPAGWLALTSHVLYLAVIGFLVFHAIQLQSRAWNRKLGVITPCPLPFALVLPALAMIAGRLHQGIPMLDTALHWPGPSALTGLLFNLGELLVVLSAFALWWAYGRSASWRTWLVAALPVLALAAAHLTNAAMTGILAIWSMGLTLYLPWPLYAVSLWLAGITVIIALRRDNYVGWAILLMAAGGYAPQLSVQAFLGLIALWLLAASPTPSVASHGTKERPVVLISELHPLPGAVFRRSVSASWETSKFLFEAYMPSNPQRRIPHDDYCGAAG
jgi:hypothetical protein